MENFDRQASTTALARILEAEGSDEDRWYHLLRLFSRPWFTRLWVVQEIALARRVLVLYEDHSIAWDLLDKVVPNLIASREILRVHFGPDIRPFIRELWDSNDLVNIRRVHKKLPILALLHDAAGRKCTNPRDRIYGLLGVADSLVQRAIYPDYSTDVLSVYRNFSIHCLSAECSLNVLSCCTYETHGENHSQWPNWICDWSRKRIDPFFMFNTTFLAAGSTISRFSISADQGTLCIEGKLVDIISVVSSHLGTTLLSHSSFEPMDLDSIRRDWLFECFALAFGKSSSDLGVLETPFAERFLLTLLAETAVNQWERPSDEDVAAFGALLKRFLSLRYTNHGPETVDGRAMAAEQIALVHANMAFAEDRRFCKTCKARLGLIPTLALPDDVICIFNGGNAPFILREDGDGYYRLIGETYINGFMDGEAMEMGDIETQEFKIR
jgi:hypothetical protein